MPNPNSPTTYVQEKETVRILAMRHSTSEWNVRLRKFKKDNNIDIIDLKWKHPHSFKTTYDKPEQIDAALKEDGVA